MFAIKFQINVETSPMTLISVTSKFLSYEFLEQKKTAKHV